MGEELEMLSRRKSFAIALSRDMVPTARVVVYYLSGQPEEIVVDSLTFFVDGTANNKVGHYFVAEIGQVHVTKGGGVVLTYTCIILKIHLSKLMSDLFICDSVLLC